MNETPPAVNTKRPPTQAESLLRDDVYIAARREFVEKFRPVTPADASVEALEAPPGTVEIQTGGTLPATPGIDPKAVYELRAQVLDAYLDGKLKQGKTPGQMHEMGMGFMTKLVELGLNPRQAGTIIDETTAIADDKIGKILGRGI